MARIEWPDDEALVALVHKEGGKGQAARALGVSATTLKDHLDRRGLTITPKTRVPQAVDPDAGPSAEEMLQAELRDLRKRVNKQRSVDVQAELVLETVRNTIRPAEPLYKAPRMDPASGHKKHVQALLLSDLHCGEIVMPEAVNGLNDFNWDVLKRRMASLQKSMVSFQRTRRYPIEELHVWLLGDNLSGNIHEELANTNEFPVAEQCWRVAMLIGQWLEQMVPHYKTIKVTGVAGNHPRTQKPHSSKQVFDSFDWLAYRIIETHLAKYSSIRCHFPRTGFEVVNIAGANILLFHGDGIRSSMPGVPFGGVMRRWNELKKQYAQQGIHLDGGAFGHFHQANVIQGQLFGNGSLIGTNEFGLKNFGGGEKPTQLLLTFQEDKKRLTDVSYLTPA